MKLCVHADCWNGQMPESAKASLDKGAGWLKIVNSPDVAYGWARAYPTKRIVYRKAEPGDLQNLSDWMSRWPDPRVCASVVERYNANTAIPNMYFEGINEPKIDTAELALWFGIHEAERSKILEAHGNTAVIGNFATGAIEPDMFEAFLISYLAAGGSTKSLIGLHEYGLATLPAGRDLYNMLGHRRLAQGRGKAFLWLITECGFDQINVGGQTVGGGWRDQGVSEDQYWEYMRDYAAELEKDPYVVAAFIFTYNGTSRWEKHELRNAPQFNKRFTEAIMARSYTRGLDISSYQNVTDPSRVKAAGFQFVFIRNADSIPWPDDKFAKHWLQFRGVLPRSQYQYLRYTFSGKAQAEFMLSRADKGDLGEMPPVVDVEQYAPDPKAYALALKEWVDTIEPVFRKKPIIYTRPDIWNQIRPYCQWAIGYPLWIARYPFASTVPAITQLQAGTYDPPELAPFGRFKFWQYSSIGYVDGIGYPVDLDVFDGDLRAFQEFIGVTIPAPVQPYTWQNWINDVFEAGTALAYPNDKIYDWLITRAGISITQTMRAQPYNGPGLSEINWSAKELAAFKAAGGKDNR